jgi:hypothetical protein
MTHKIAGPLHNIGLAFARVRDNRLPPDLGKLRKGDELQAFHASFREMYEAVRARVISDRDSLEKAIAAIESQPSRSADLEAVLTELRALQRDKVESLSQQR